jgi:hypothetical protein
MAQRRCEHFGCTALAVVSLDDGDPKGEHILNYMCLHHAGDFISVRGDIIWRAQYLVVPEIVIPEPEVSVLTKREGLYLKFTERAPVRSKLLKGHTVIAHLDEFDSVVGLEIPKKVLYAPQPSEEDGA